MLKLLADRMSIIINYFVSQDEMKAAVHIENVRLSPITLEAKAIRDELDLASETLTHGGMNLSQLLAMLPEQERETGPYFELRKLKDSWVCVKTSFTEGKDYCSNADFTPEGAVFKMLVRQQIVPGCENCFHSAMNHHPGCKFCSCRKYLGNE